MNRLKVAVIGVGALGRHHARILSELPEVELIGVVDSHADRGREVAEKHGTTWFAQPDSLHDVAEAVSIVVPTGAHLAVARPFLMRGVPVLVEKPLAADTSQAQELFDLAAEHGALLQVGHIEQFNPALVAARPYCQAPKYIRAERVSSYTFRSIDIGVVLDLMIHDIEVAQSLAKSPVAHIEAFGIGVMGGHEDAAQARLYFENGCIADLTASRVHPTAARTLAVWSAAGQVSVDLHARTVETVSPTDLLKYGPSPCSQAQMKGANIEALKQQVFGGFLKRETIAVPPGDALTDEIRHFIDCIQSQSAPRVGGYEALGAMRVAEGVLESIARHQWDGTNVGPIGAYPAAMAPSHRRAG